MWSILAVLAMLLCIGFLASIVKPPKPKEGQAPMTRKQAAKGAAICFFLSMVFFAVADDGDSTTTTATKTNSEIESTTETAAAPTETKTEQPQTPQSPESSSNESKTDDTLFDGDMGVLNNDCFVAVNEEAQKEMYNYLNANNKEALLNMIVRGQIINAPKGTRITVVDRGFVTAEIEIMETGERGLVPVEFLAKK